LLLVLSNSSENAEIPSISSIAESIESFKSSIASQEEIQKIDNKEIIQIFNFEVLILCISVITHIFVYLFHN
jgi:hypothetical protein